LAAAADDFRPSAPFGVDLGSSSRRRCSCCVGQGVTTSVSLVVGWLRGAKVLALALLMVMAGVVVHLFRRHRVSVGEASGESLPGCGVGVNIGGVFGRHGPPWRRCVGMLPALVGVL
jgi:hypothetical protein